MQWLEREFANYLSLSASQFLVFQYQESSFFNVIVLDKNGLEIKYPLIEISQESTEIESSESSLQVNEDPSPMRRLGRPKSSSKVCKKKRINPKEPKESKLKNRKVQIDARFHNLMDMDKGKFYSIILLCYLLVLFYGIRYLIFLNFFIELFKEI